MKKTISAILALVMVLSLCACGSPAPTTVQEADTEPAGAEANISEEPAAEEPVATDWQSVYYEAAALYYVDYDYPAALEKLQGAEDSGNASALYLLGLILYNGNGTEPDTSKGAELLTKAADLGSADAKYALAEAYRTGNGVEHDSEKADELYKAFLTAAENVEPSAAPEYIASLYNISMCYYYGRGTEADMESAAKYAEMVLDDSDKATLETYSIAAMYETGNLGETYAAKAQTIYAEVFPHVEVLANKGIHTAERYLAQYYEFGDGGAEKDYDKALEWFEKAASGGDASAMFNIGVMYRNGVGVEEDHSKALEWYEKAADLGFSNAMFNIGALYVKGGYGVETDYAEALKWFEKAAEFGEEKAVEYISILREQGLVS